MNLWKIGFYTYSITVPSTGEIHIRFPSTATVSSTCTVYVSNTNSSLDPLMCELVNEGSYKFYKITRKTTNFPQYSGYNMHAFFEVLNDPAIASPGYLNSFIILFLL